MIKEVKLERRKIFAACSEEIKQHVFNNLKTFGYFFAQFVAVYYPEQISFDYKRHYLTNYVDFPGLAREFILLCSVEDLNAIIRDLEITKLEFIGYCAKVYGDDWDFDNLKELILSKQKDSSFKSFLEMLSNKQLQTILPKLAIDDFDIVYVCARKLEHEFDASKYIEVIRANTRLYEIKNLLNHLKDDDVALIFSEIKFEDIDLVRSYLKRLGDKFPFENYMTFILSYSYKYYFDDLIKELTPNQTKKIIHELEIKNLSDISYFAQKIGEDFDILKHIEIIDNNKRGYGFGNFLRTLSDKQLLLVIKNIKLPNLELVTYCVGRLQKDFDISSYLEMVSELATWRFFDFIKGLANSQLLLVLESYDKLDFQSFVYCLERLKGSLEIRKFLPLIKNNIREFENQQVIKMLNPEQNKIVLSSLDNLTSMIVADGVEGLEDNFDFEIESFNTFYKLFKKTEGKLNIEQHIKLIEQNQTHENFQNFIESLSREQLLLVIDHIRIEDFGLLVYVLQQLGDDFNINGYIDLINENIEAFEKLQVVKMMSQQQLKYVMPRLVRHSLMLLEPCKTILDNKFDFEIKSFKFLYKLVESKVEGIDIEMQLDLIVENQDAHEFNQFLSMLSDAQFIRVISKIKISDFSMLTRCITLLRDSFDMSGYGSLINKNMNFGFLSTLSAKQINQILGDLYIDEELFDFLVQEFGDNLEIHLMEKYILSKQGFVISMPKLLDSLSNKLLKDVHEKVKFTKCLVGPTVILEKMGDAADVALFVEAFNNEKDESKVIEFLEKCSPKQLTIIEDKCNMKYADFKGKFKKKKLPIKIIENKNPKRGSEANEE